MEGVAMELESTLVSLRDIEGIHGSFLFSRRGVVLARDLPSVFGSDILSEAALRTTRLWETFAELDRTIESCILRYREHKLYVRPVLQGLLCVLTPPSVNMSALRMAVNLVTKRLNRILADFDFSTLEATAGLHGNGIPQSAPVPEPPPSNAGHVITTPTDPPASSRATISSRRQLVYRGRRYDG
jgi:predicted regulator of Ras-like GTPase activity (Roadblock/LC7/MglB family)